MGQEELTTARIRQSYWHITSEEFRQCWVFPRLTGYVQPSLIDVLSVVFGPQQNLNGREFSRLVCTVFGSACPDVQALRRYQKIAATSGRLTKRDIGEPHALKMRRRNHRQTDFCNQARQMAERLANRLGGSAADYRLVEIIHFDGRRWSRVNRWEVLREGRWQELPWTECMF